MILQALIPAVSLLALADLHAEAARALVSAAAGTALLLPLLYWLLWGVAVDVGPEGVPRPSGLELLGRAGAAVVCGGPLVYCAACLLGAPLVDGETAAWSAYACSVALVPAACRLGLPVSRALCADVQQCRARWWRMCVQLRPRGAQEHAATLPAAGALLGGWGSTLCGPLDWNTPWQRWPIASSYGVCVGGALGCVLVLAALRRKLPEQHPRAQ